MSEDISQYSHDDETSWSLRELMKEFQKVSKAVRDKELEGQDSDSLRLFASNLLSAYKEVSIAEANSRARVAEANSKCSK